MYTTPSSKHRWLHRKRSFADRFKHAIYSIQSPSGSSMPARQLGAALMADEKTEKTRAVDTAISQIEKQFGKGSIMKLGSKEAVVPISVISTGSISFDAALGFGGVPRGRV